MRQLTGWWLNPAGRFALLAIATGALAIITALARHPVVTGYLFLLAAPRLHGRQP